MTTIQSLPQPVIAQVHGIATAAGCQLVASCDLAVADKSARFGVNGVNIGLFCSTPMVALSRVVKNKHAMEMLLMGDFIKADKAKSIGLINNFFKQEDLTNEVNFIANKISNKSSLTLKIGKKSFYEKKIDSLISIQWSGSSDSEILVELIDYFGIKEALIKTRGMFAISVWDAKEKKLTLCRDRLGEKPLYYGWQ